MPSNLTNAEQYFSHSKPTQDHHVNVHVTCKHRIGNTAEAITSYNGSTCVCVYYIASVIKIHTTLIGKVPGRPQQECKRTHRSFHLRKHSLMQ